MVPKERFLEAPETGVGAQKTNTHSAGIGDLAA